MVTKNSLTQLGNSLTQTEIQFCYLFNSDTKAGQSIIKNENNNEQHV